MTKISQLSDIGANLAANDEFLIRDVSDASTPNKKVTSSGFVDYVISQGSVTGFTQIAAGVGPLARALASSSGATGTLAFSTAAATTLIERARIDSSGRLLVGTPSASNNLRINQAFAVVTAGNPSYGGAALTTYAGTTAVACPVFDLNRSRGTTDGSFTKVEAGDRLGVFVFRGSDGVGFSDAAAIEAYADGEWTTSGDTTDCPGRLVFSTATDGAAVTTERMRIDNAGRVAIGTTATGGSRLLTVGSNTPGGGGTLRWRAGQFTYFALQNAGNSTFTLTINRGDVARLTGTVEVIQTGELGGTNAGNGSNYWKGLFHSGSYSTDLAYVTPIVNNIHIGGNVSQSVTSATTSGSNVIININNTWFGTIDVLVMCANASDATTVTLAAP